MKGWAFIAGYIVAGVLMIVYRDLLTAWLQADVDSWRHETLAIVTAFTIAVVPAVPYGIVAALFGAKYGAFAGGLVNLSVSVAAAAVLFLWVRYAFTDEQRTRAASFKGLGRLTGFMERSPFSAILLARLLPVVPAQAINAYAAVTRMDWKTFLLATAVGKIPFVLTATLLGDQWASDSRSAVGIVLIVGVYVGFLLLVWLVFRLKASK